ncbi:unnamed protein product [Phyllotreta striolata]|uniref:HEAT repeat-containing protein 6 n=1 Tax=Phyllotreta striolata TaxID=444603 RepID=A0A9N9XVD3_PHYSR|nr:unnamed protein product [Phyllotreta striolata]
MAASVDSCEIFNNVSSQIVNLLHGRTDSDRNILSRALDELNSLNYRYAIVTNPTKAILLVNQCCSFISTDDNLLVQKCSQFLWNLVKRQSVPVEGKSLVVAINWCLDSTLKSKDKIVVLEVLQALDALLRINIDQILSLTDKVVQVVLKVLEQGEKKWSPEVALMALQCLEACTVETETTTVNREKLLENCANTFISQLSKPEIVEYLVHIKMLEICIRGLQNIVSQNTDYLKKEMGLLLGIVKTYMVYGINDINYMPPQKLSPSTLSIPEITINRERKGGKLMKQRKQRISVLTKKEKNVIEDFVFDKNAGYIPATMSLDCNSDNGFNLNAFGSKIKTSDSDFSDSESNLAANITKTQSKTRQAAFGLFYNIIRNSDKSTIFSYWTSFIPEGTVSGPHNLVVCILKDPSSRCRTSALNVLLALLRASKLYLSHAEYSEKPSAFTPFSMILGLMIKELHKGICLALNETSVPVLTQLLKCLAALVQATPYHKMEHGLLGKVVTNVKPFIYHKDSTVQVTALIVLGCILASEPVVAETKEVMLSSPQHDDNKKPLTHADLQEDDSIPWLLKKCLSNLGVQFDDNKVKAQLVPAPVKLESLQVISALTRNYFDVLLASHVPYLAEGLTLSLSDQNIDVKLHAGRAVDFIGHGIYKFVTNQDAKDSIPFDDFVRFWESLLRRPLIILLQSEDQPSLRSVGCDCIGSIGSDIFEQLTRDKQILCITMLFAATRDDEDMVKAAAVRALAICVMYTSLREDSGFVVDTAEAIYRTLNDASLMVRTKASWSLGNLSEALVLNNKGDGDVEEIPHNLVLKLLEIGIKGASDNDKIKMNCVRALGNLINLINAKLLGQVEFCRVVDKAFEALVKNCSTGSNMKVRWNACYAIGNALKNTVLYEQTTRLDKTWQSSVFKALTELVVNFKNFKVRINAALALSVPSSRECFGNHYYNVWTALLEALENSQNMEDLSEYIHRDHLIEQVCLSLGHLVTLLEKNDLVLLQNCIDLYYEVFRHHTQKVLERLIPEKSSTLISATFSLNQLSNQNGLSRSELEVLDRLKTIFTTIV